MQFPTIMTSMTSFILYHLITLLTIPTLIHSHPLNTSSFPTITTYIALGDSYASGNGAGRTINAFCGRFSSAYPEQLAQSIGPVRFHNAACGGASTSTVIWDQFSWITEETDLVTLTVGGNEVDFFRVLNECVYRWRALGTCEGQLERSRGLIERKGFGEGYVGMVGKGVERLRRGGGTGRLLVTGYATFFNEKTTACDGVSFSRTHPQQFLTTELRRELNQLVRLLNVAIRDAAEVSGAEYVDIDQAFEGHRFCENGVSEPDNNRSDTWFFNLQYDHGEAVESWEVHQGHSQDLISATSLHGFVDVTRVFHPTTNGHGGIGDAIIKQLRDQ